MKPSILGKLLIPICLAISAFSLGLTACSHSRSAQGMDPNINIIIKGQTTQAEAEATLGMPNKITTELGSESHELWTYKYDTRNAALTEKLKSLFLLDSDNSTESSNMDSPYDLLLSFDSEKIVKDYFQVPASKTKKTERIYSSDSSD